jgi:hypothetical protein
MQQQRADYDLLAVFNDQSDADTAAAKLQKAGFGDEEVFRLDSNAVAGGQFRDHGPNRERSTFFLQTGRSGPNFRVVILLALIFGLVLGVVMFLAHFAFVALPEPTTAFEGLGVGIVLGAIIGLLRRGPVRGAIGQDLSRVTPPTQPPVQGAKTVIALRFADSENIARHSQARAILTNSKGKIDRSIGRSG